MPASAFFNAINNKLIPNAIPKKPLKKDFKIIEKSIGIVDVKYLEFIKKVQLYTKKDIVDLVDRVEHHLQELGEKEIHAVKVGEKVIQEIYNLDDVAYVRFASVYRSFKDVNEFMVELKEVLKSKDSTKPRDQWQ